MKAKNVIAAILVGLLFTGCGGNDNTADSAAKKAPAVAEQEQIFTEQTVAKINEVAKPLIEQAEKTTERVAARVVEKAEVAKQKSFEFAATVQEKSVPVMEKTGSALIVAGQQVQQAAEVMKAPQNVVIDNKNGPVTLPHRVHGKSFGCPACHGDQAAPGPMQLGKEKAHALCKGCHKQKAAGPTKCSGCHVKKKAAGVEGC